MMPVTMIFILGLLLFKAAPLWARDTTPQTPPGAPSDSMVSPLPQPGGTAAMSDIHDIKPALAVGADLTLWLWVAAGVLVLAALALAWFLWRRRKRSKSEQADTPEVPADVQALNDLDALAAEGDLDGKAFYFRLSAVLRTYLERRYAFAAAEMTTEELLPVVDRLRWSVEMKSALRDFCRSSDPIKFAEAPARRDRMVADLAYARELVLQTRVTEENAAGDEANGDGHQSAAQPEAAGIRIVGQAQHRIAYEPSGNPETRQP